MTSSYDTIIKNGCNHCVREISYPKRTTLCVGASVMLLRNFIVEWKIMNGSIGVVRQISYHHPDGPTHDPSCLPAYVIVEIPQSIISVDKKYFQICLQHGYIHQLLQNVAEESVAILLIHRAYEVTTKMKTW